MKTEPSITDAAVGTTALTYNPAGQVQTVDDPLVSGSALTSYTYNTASGRLEQRLDAQSNMRWTRAYDDADTGRLLNQTIRNNTTSAVLASFDLDYDKASNVTSKTSDVFANPSDATWTYAYDPANRLIQATGKNAAGTNTVWDYEYDGGGNRTRIKESQGTSVISNLTTTYDAAGLPVTASKAGESITYTHDKAGNLTLQDSSVSTNDWSYTYDAYSRLTCAKQATSCSSGTTRVQLDGAESASGRSANSYVPARHPRTASGSPGIVSPSPPETKS